MRPEGVFDYNRHYVNDLPATSPHGSYSEYDARNAGFAADPDATRGTPVAHRDTYLSFSREGLIIAVVTMKNSRR
jgi:hypothetical protein